MEGAPGSPVALSGPAFGGIILIGNGRAKLARARIEGETSVIALDESSLEAALCRFEGGLAGAVCAGFSRVRLRRCEASVARRSGFEARDDARLAASGCSVRGCGSPLAVRDDARALWVRGRVSECSLPATVEGAASLRSSLSRWERCAVSTRDRARFSSRSDRWTGGGALAVETLSRSSARVARPGVASVETAFWAQNSSSLEVSGGAVSASRIGLKTSHAARASAEGLACEGVEACFFAEEDARLSLRGCRVSGTSKPVVKVGRALIEADESAIIAS